MSFINNKYFQSKHVKIFPSSFRGQYTKSGDTNQITIDPEARLNTEANFVQPKSDIGKNTYIIEYNETDKIIKFILGGYYFEISEIDKYIDYLAKDEKEIGIKFREITLKASDEADSERFTKILDSWESNSEDILDMSTEIEQVVYYYFTGLKVLDKNESSSYRIKLFNEDKSLCKEKLLPKIDHGTGDNTLTHGEGLNAAYTNQTVLGKYNSNNPESIFEIGIGVSDVNRKNAVEVNSTKTTLNSNVDIINTLTTKENLVVNGTSELDGNVKIDSTTVSNNTSSGALVVAGGVGVGDGVNVANKLNVGNVLIVKKNPADGEKNVKVDGSLYVTGNSIIANSATITTNKITINKPLDITDSSANALKVGGDTTIAKNLSVGNTTKVFEVKPTVSGTEKNVAVTGTFSAGDTSVGPLTVTGTTNINGTTNIIGGVNINQAVSEPSPTNINGTTNITGATNIIGAVNINQGENIDAQDVKINGNVNVTGKLTSTYTEYSDTDTTALTTKSYVDSKHLEATTHTNDKVNALTLDSTGGDGKYIKLISQANGQVLATENSFETTLDTSTTNNAPTSAAVGDYVSSEISNIWTFATVKETNTATTNKSLQQIILDAAYPIGSIYMHYSDKALVDCPIKNTLGGTWDPIVNTPGTFLCTASSDSSSKYFVGKTGGSANAKIIHHTHKYWGVGDDNLITISGGEHTHMVAFRASECGKGDWTGFEGNTGDHKKEYVLENTLTRDTYNSVKDANKTSNASKKGLTESYGEHGHTLKLPSIQHEGETGTDSNLPPYITVYMWKRVA